MQIQNSKFKIQSSEFKVQRWNREYWLKTELLLTFLIVFVVIVLFGCGSGNRAGDPTYNSLSSIQKNTDIYTLSACETTPIAWQGKLLLVEFFRGEFGKTGFLIRDFDSKAIVYENTKYEYSAFGSALVFNNTLYVFGIKDQWRTGNHIGMTSSTDLKAWTESVEIFTAPSGIPIFNTSITGGPFGFVLAYETADVARYRFTTHFALSTDLLSWTPIGSMLDGECPTVRYVDGWYLITYLRCFGSYCATFVARTKDFVDLDLSDICMLSPLDASMGGSEGSNNSDVDFVEWNGSVVITYADGNQKDWADVKIALYRGSLERLMAEFWPGR
jgi:hypothetical protein